MLRDSRGTLRFAKRSRFLSVGAVNKLPKSYISSMPEVSKRARVIRIGEKIERLCLPIGLLIARLKREVINISEFVIHGKN